MLDYKESIARTMLTDTSLIDHLERSPTSSPDHDHHSPGTVDDTTPSHSHPSSPAASPPPQMSQSPQRARKATSYQDTTGIPLQPSPQREKSPSPSLKEKQRQARTQSMPIIAPLNQQQLQHPTSNHQHSPAQHSPTNSTFSHQQHQRPSPSGSSKPPVGGHYSNDMDHTRPQAEARPPLVQSHSVPGPSIHHPVPSRSTTLPYVLDSFNMTEMGAVMADIDQIAPPFPPGGNQQFQQDQISIPIQPVVFKMSGSGPGMSGVAYAGGVTSSGRGYIRSENVHPVIERVRGVGETQGPRQPVNNSNRAHRTSPRESLDSSTNQRIQQQQQPRRDSPMRVERLVRAASPLAKVHYPDESASEEEHPTIPISQAPKRRSLGASPPSQNARATPSATSILTGHHTPPAANRTPDRDRSLPLQEDLEDTTITPATIAATAQATHTQNQPVKQRERSRTITSTDYGREHRQDGSPKPSHSESHFMDPEPRPPLVDSEDENAGRTSRAAYRPDDDEKTLFEQQSSGRDDGGSSKTVSESEGVNTPRSPLHQLPEQWPHLQAQLNALHGMQNGMHMGMNMNGMNMMHMNGGAAAGMQYRTRPRGGMMDQMAAFPIEAMLHQYSAMGGGVPGQAEYFQAPQADEYSPHYFEEEMWRAYQPSPGIANNNYMPPHMSHGHGVPGPSHARAPNGHHRQQPQQQQQQQSHTPQSHTPQPQTVAPSPSPFVSDGGSGGNNAHSIMPPFSPDGTYPYPYSHMRRNQYIPASQNNDYIASPALPGGVHHPNMHLNDEELAQQHLDNANGGGSNMNYMSDPNLRAIQQQLTRQIQQYGLNQLGDVSDSTLSPAASPSPVAQYNPWRILERGPRARLLDAASSAASMRSSPSQMPLELPGYINARNLRRRLGASKLGAGSGLGMMSHTNTVSGLTGRGMKQHQQPPPRVESTQPRETSPEVSSGEETAGEIGDPPSATRPLAIITSDDAEWVDDDENEESDLLDLEFHTSYVSNTEKRRRRWDAKWEALVQAFQDLDRQTDGTMVLLAAPSHSSKLHSLSSRALRRDQALFNSPSFKTMRSSFRDVANRRKASRLQSISLMERLASLRDSGSGGEQPGSPSSSTGSAREDDLRRALGAALSSLSTLKKMYDQRENRWKEEWNVLSEEREGVQILLSQALGADVLAQAAAAQGQS